MGKKKKSGVNTAESRVSPTKNHSKGEAIRSEAKPTREPSVDLRGELLKLHHDNKTAFVELVAGMVELLVELDFREIAAMYSSWPVNIPALRVRSRSKKKESIKPFHQRNREEQCECIMDDLLQVGSGLQRIAAGENSRSEKWDDGFGRGYREYHDWDPRSPRS